MDADDLDMFERGLRDVTRRTTGVELDAELDELGWDDALVDDERSAVSLLFGLQGEACATSSALCVVVAHALGLSDPPGTWASTVLPPAGAHDPPGILEGERLQVDGMGASGLTTLESARVVAAAADSTTIAFMVPTVSLDLHPVTGVDPDLGLLRVTGEVRAAGSGITVGPGAWDAAVGLGRLALAHELVGCSRSMLDLACEHARGRVQFDRPIAAFQAVRHRLADTLVAVSMAEALLEAAWLDPTPDASSMAKAVAGRQARVAGRHCQQILAGIGFTVEHPFHRYVRRTLVLDALFGTAASLTTSLGVDVADRRQLPPLLPL